MLTAIPSSSLRFTRSCVDGAFLPVSSSLSHMIFPLSTLFHSQLRSALSSLSRILLTLTFACLVPSLPLADCPRTTSLERPFLIIQQQSHPRRNHRHPVLAEDIFIYFLYLVFAFPQKSIHLKFKYQSIAVIPSVKNGA